jgi:uncharacterized membrane protein YukC
MESWLEASLKIVCKSWYKIAKSFKRMDISLFIFCFSSLLLFLIVFFVLSLEQFHDALLEWDNAFVNKGWSKLLNEIINTLNCCAFHFIIIIFGHHHKQARYHHCSEYLLQR